MRHFRLTWSQQTSPFALYVLNVAWNSPQVSDGFAKSAKLSHSEFVCLTS
jgi:hypothetical protein